MSVVCDANKLPEEIKVQAKNYCTNELEHSYADTKEELEEDVMRAWLHGFAFCLEGAVNVKVKQCVTCVYTDSPCVLSDYAKDAKGYCERYKNVFEQNAELQQKIQVLNLNGNIAVRELTKAKELLKRCYENYIYLQPLRNEIEQFLKE